MKLKIVLLIMILVFCSKVVSAETFSEGSLIREYYPCWDRYLLAWEKNGTAYFLSTCNATSNATVFLRDEWQMQAFGNIFSIGDKITVNGTLYENKKCILKNETYDHICVENIEIVESLPARKVIITVYIDNQTAEGISLNIESYYFRDLIDSGNTNANGVFETSLKPSQYYLTIGDYEHVQKIDILYTEVTNITVNLSSSDSINGNAQSQKNDKTPGFELAIMLATLIFVILLKYKKKK